MTSHGVLPSLALLLTMLALTPRAASAQTERPLPHPIIPPPHYQVAVDLETRTDSGAPGPNYWQNYASYEIDAVLSPSTKALRAEGRIRYFNKSPDPLGRLYLHLRQNLHREGAIRNRAVPITGGIELTKVDVGGQPLVEQPHLALPGYAVNGTILRIELPEPLLPGDSTDLHLAWRFTVPGPGTPRMGQDGEVFFLGFWYPQMAVYDDVYGWNVDPYLGLGEFYMGFADYDVRVTVPDRWLVAATGLLQNASEVLAARVLERLDVAATADSIVQVVTTEERDSATTSTRTGTHTWHFRASRVRDFAFGASSDYVWDATVANIPGGEPVEIHALYRPGTKAWDQDAEFLRWSVEWLSERLTPYPFPHMTAVEGLISGGMEYPMLTLIGGNRTPVTLFRTTFHEVAHIWYPMLVSQNEKAFGWMDEGLVSLPSDDALREYWNEDAYYRQYYTRVAATGLEVPAARHTDEFPIATSARNAALYGKPTVALQALRGIVGEAAFDEASRTYIERWAYRHPYPWDFFRTFNEVLGQDFDWFWSSVIYETWVLDHALTSVEAESTGVRVAVTDEGLLPLPAVVQVTYADGRTERQTVPVSHWLSGNTKAELAFSPGEVEHAMLDPEQVNPDIDWSDDEWRP